MDVFEALKLITEASNSLNKVCEESKLVFPGSTDFYNDLLSVSCNISTLRDDLSYCCDEIQLSINIGQDYERMVREGNEEYERQEAERLKLEAAQQEVAQQEAERLLCEQDLQMMLKEKDDNAAAIEEYERQEAERLKLEAAQQEVAQQEAERLLREQDLQMMLKEKDDNAAAIEEYERQEAERLKLEAAQQEAEQEVQNFVEPLKPEAAQQKAKRILYNQEEWKAMLQNKNAAYAALEEWHLQEVERAAQEED